MWKRWQPMIDKQTEPNKTTENKTTEFKGGFSAWITKKDIKNGYQIQRLTKQ